LRKIGGINLKFVVSKENTTKLWRIKLKFVCGLGFTREGSFRKPARPKIQNGCQVDILDIAPSSMLTARGYLANWLIRITSSFKHCNPRPLIF
jgi:hypothetical protein